jgi:hypothetical protein
MPPIKANPSSFLTIPADARKAIYDVSDKKALGRLAQTCKQVNDEIKPGIVKVGQEVCAPSDTLRKRNFPNIHVPAIRTPQSAKSIHQAAKLQKAKRLEEITHLAIEKGHLNFDEGFLVYAALHANVQRTK